MVCGVTWKAAHDDGVPDRGAGRMVRGSAGVSRVRARMGCVTVGRTFYNELAADIARRVAAELREQADEQISPGGWMDTTAAAEYAGCSVHSLRKAIAARELEIRQSGTGGKVWTRREWIDAWRGL